MGNRFVFEKGTRQFLKSAGSFETIGDIVLRKSENRTVELELRNHVKGGIYDLDTDSGLPAATVTARVFDLTDPVTPVELGSATLSSGATTHGYWTGSLDMRTSAFDALFTANGDAEVDGVLEFRVVSAAGLEDIYQVDVRLGADGLVTGIEPYTFYFRDVTADALSQYIKAIPPGYDFTLQYALGVETSTTLPTTSTVASLGYGFTTALTGGTDAEVQDDDFDPDVRASHFLMVTPAENTTAQRFVYVEVKVASDATGEKFDIALVGWIKPID